MTKGREIWDTDDPAWDYLLRMATKYGFTAGDLESARRATGKYPRPEQVQAADDRDVALALIEARRRRLGAGP